MSVSHCTVGTPQGPDPAVAYLRKSTRGDRGGREKQEKSLAQQREEIIKLARGRFEVLQWFEDEGVSGWKRGAKRPDFQRMIAEARALGARAILCDHIDRFSRATYDDVHEDVRELRKAGVCRIVTASHGEYDLGHRNDIAEIIKFAAAVWAAHEYSRNLGRRIARARRDGAEEGRRTGGPAPYGLANDGEGGLVAGDPAEAEVVRWLFDQFVNHLRSLSWLAGDLNLRKVPPPRGKAWYPKTVGVLLRQRAYRGDFEFNRDHRGQFFGIDAGGNVADAEDLAAPGTAPGKVFHTAGAYDAPLVEPGLFDRAQARLATLAQYRSRRKRQGYALTGVLVCDHCGTLLYGMQVLRDNGKYSPTVYRCNARRKLGRRAAACQQYQVREDLILPFILGMLGEEVADLTRLNSFPPEELCRPDPKREEERAGLRARRDELAARIARAEENLLDVSDPRTRKSLDARVTALRDELDRLDAELELATGGAPEDSPGAVRADRLAALAAWWDEFTSKAVRVPVRLPVCPGEPDEESFPATALVDPRKANEALLELGTEVRLRWETTEVRTRAGGTRNRYLLKKGRFRLGQRRGDVPGCVLGSTAVRRASPRRRRARARSGR
jgi:DNA invertase Pin-like site-specific DNA recombinase